MKINDREISSVKFIVRDGLTNQKFGGRKNFGFMCNIYDLPDIIYFSHTEELRETIELLTDMYELAMKDRGKQERLREALK